MGTRTYYITVDATGTTGGYTLRVAVHNPGTPSTSCGGVLFDVSAGGTMAGLYPGGASQHNGGCGGAAPYTEDVLSYNPAASLRPTLTLVAAMPIIYVRQVRCGGMGATDLLCQTGSSPLTITPVFLPALASYIIVDGGRAAGERYALFVYP